MKKGIYTLFIMALPFMVNAQGVTTTVNVAPGTPVNLNAASGTATNVKRPGTSSCSSSGANMYRIGDGSGRVKLCVTDWSNLSTSCGGGNNKEDIFRIYTDQNADGTPETVYSYFSNASAASSAGMELNVTGPGVFDCQNCVMSPAGSGYIWVYYCGNGTCDAGDMASSHVSFTWESYPVSPNDAIGAAQVIDTCSQTFTINNYDATATHNGCGYNAPPCFQNDLDNNTGTALSPNGAPTSNNGGDVGYSVESDIWFVFNPGLLGTWTLTFTPRDCFASNGISSGADACDFYSNGFQYALFEGTSASNFTTLVSGGTNGQNLTAAQAIPINVTTTATTYYLQIEGYAGVGCEFDAVLTPPGAVCTLIPLPINLLNFDATVEDNNKVNLNWLVSSEINNDYFTIERSLDGKTFEVVGIVDGAGNSSMVKNYNLVDDNPYTGTSYYRLKQTDYDNTSTYSNVVAVDIKTSVDELTLYPNPVTGNAQLAFDMNVAGDVFVQVHDVSGRLVLAERTNGLKGQNTIELTTDQLNRGMYFLTLRSGEELVSTKFIKE